MKASSKIILIASIFFSFCTRHEAKLVPADETLVTKPVENFTLQDMKKIRVLVKTNFGDFVIGFLPDKAPTLTKNFIRLVQQGFYNGLRFHMIIPQYMVISGDPKGDGTGGPGYWVKHEFNDLPHLRGSVGMSHPPFAPASIGSQFYILLANSMRETNAYPVFGYVERGMDVLDRIGAVPTSGPSSQPIPWMPQQTVRIESMTLMVEESK